MASERDVNVGKMVYNLQQAEHSMKRETWDEDGQHAENAQEV
jgi:hypothetical protein